ncbi:MAG: hypothetical protein JNL67_19220 [Planctomycetaceae bacterium]|nr:hypothetical protein [Planctomycetaceae bacterium]
MARFQTNNAGPQTGRLKFQKLGAVAVERSGLLVKSTRLLVGILGIGIATGIVANSLWTAMHVDDFWRPVFSGALVAMAVTATLQYQDHRMVLGQSDNDGTRKKVV